MEDFCLGRAAGARLPPGPSVRPSAHPLSRWVSPLGARPGTGGAGLFPRGPRPSGSAGPGASGEPPPVRGAPRAMAVSGERLPDPAGNRAGSPAPPVTGFCRRTEARSELTGPAAGARRGSGTTAPGPVTDFRCPRDRSAALPLRSVTVTVTARRNRVPPFRPVQLGRRRGTDPPPGTAAPAARGRVGPRASR